MFSGPVLAFGVLGCVSAVAANTIIHDKWQKSAIVKLDTPGYPLWLMDKANAPIEHKNAEKYYWEQDKPSAILLNLTMSADNKTLLINHQPILPFANSNTPPLIEAYQIPAEYTERQVRSLMEMKLLNREWEGLTLGWRFLALDYDRLVWADPETGPYQNHNPRLSFRLMGIGAHSRSDVLDAERQKVLHVTLTDVKHGSSDSPDRAYAITGIEFKDIHQSYAYTYETEPEERPCTTLSWRCPDVGLYREGAPYYRFIWRSRFDEYGRIGSRRHQMFSKMGVLSKIWRDAGLSMVSSFAILFGSAMAVLVVVFVYKKAAELGDKRLRRAVGLDDRLLGENEDGLEKFIDEDEQEVPPPVPPKKKPIDVLIDLEPGTDA